jgi:flagellar hook-associated protein 3 FlgL
VNTRITQSTMSRTVLTDLQAAAHKLAKTQQKISSGKELTAPSDSPYLASRALDLRSELEANRQYQSNVGEAQAWQSATDEALGAINTYVLRARELVARAGAGTLSQNDLDAIAKEVDQLAAAIKNEGNSLYAGRYIFSGTSTDTAPYADADDLYHGAASPSPVRREIGPGVQVEVNIVAADVIGDGTTGILGALRQVSAHLTAGDVASLQNSDLGALDAAHDQLISQRAVTGALGNRLATAAERLAQLEESTTKLLSNTEDADMAKTLIDFSTQQAAYQAALQAGARMLQPSLLDFLS